MAGSIDFNTRSVTALAVESLRASVPKAEKAVEREEPAQTTGAKDLMADRNLTFSVDKESGRIIVKVTDSATGEVIREIPPEDAVKAHELLGAPAGLLVDAAS